MASGVFNTARSGAEKFFGSFFQKRTSCLSCQKAHADQRQPNKDHKPNA
jgi:hypothetical protein